MIISILFKAPLNPNAVCQGPSGCRLCLMVKAASDKLFFCFYISSSIWWNWVLHSWGMVKIQPPLICSLNVESLNFCVGRLKDVQHFPSQSCVLDPICLQALHAAKSSFLQKLPMWVTPKPVYIFRRSIASCTAIIMLTAWSAHTHIFHTYTCRKTNYVQTWKDREHW